MQGRHWDSVPIPNVTVADLKPKTFEFFRKQGAKSKRLGDDVFRNFRITSEILYHPQIPTTMRIWI
jgi:hypothetical protein